MPDQIPDGISREHVLSAIKDFESGKPHGFSPSISYDLIHEGKRFPPKAIIGLAAAYILETPLGPDDFKGGLKSKCFRTLTGLGFSKVPKSLEKTEPFAVTDTNGQPFDAHFLLERNEDGDSLILESRGGSRGSSNARNFDYLPALSILLTRVGYLKLLIRDADAESLTTQRMNLSRNERQLQLSSFEYPIKTADVANIDSLRTELCAAQRPIGRKDGAKGSGNNTKRIRLYLSPSELELDELAQELAGWSMPIDIPDLEDQNAAQETSSFDPTDIQDARRKVISATIQRQGQPAFRASLIEAYSGQCAFSGCQVLEVLEAAHIAPYKGNQTNHVQNGLLLRSDIHLLFDRGLIGIDTENEVWKVVLSSALQGTNYDCLSGVPVSLPTDLALRPNKEALLIHRRSAGI